MQKIGEVIVYKNVSELLANNIIAIFLGEDGVGNNWEWADAKELKT